MRLPKDNKLHIVMATELVAKVGMFLKWCSGPGKFFLWGRGIFTLMAEDALGFPFFVFLLWPD